MNDIEINRLIDLSSVGSVESSLQLFSYFVDKDPRRAFEFLIRVEGSLNSEILRNIGNCYAQGIGVNKSIENALFYYERAKALGDYISSFNIALLLYKEKRYDECVPYLTYAATYNHIQALKMLGEFYHKGISVNKNDFIAINMFKKAIELGDITSLNNISILFYETKDYTNAFIYLTKAYENGEFKTLHYLANLYLSGQGVEKNINKALNLLNFGAENKLIPCIKELISLYQNGVIDNKNISNIEELKKKITS